jgi:hypothetical protein
MTVNDIVQSYGSAWNTSDEAERRALLEKAWADDGVYADPMGRAEGRDALVAHIAGFQEQMPGNRIVLTSGVDQHGNVLRFGWEMQGPDGATLMEGVDFGTLAADGRLASITGFFGPLPPQG